MNGGDSLGGIAFLDTNTLHFTDIYLHYSRAQQLDPSSAADRSIVEHRLTEMENQALRRSIQGGMRTVDWLLSRNLRVEYSPVSELELISGRARGAALLNAAREGIPDRMWTRISDADVEGRVSADELRAIDGRFGTLSDRLEALGIRLRRGEDRAREVWVLARRLAGLVYLSPNDGVIYAGALCAQADYLITSDRYLGNTINGIRSAERPRLRDVRNQVIDMVRTALFALAPAIDVSLPAAVAPASLRNPYST